MNTEPRNPISLGGQALPSGQMVAKPDCELLPAAQGSAAAEGARGAGGAAADGVESAIFACDDHHVLISPGERSGAVDEKLHEPSVLCKESVYKASQIARSLGKTTRAVLAALVGAQPAEFAVAGGSRGPSARGWRLASLPVLMQERLNGVAHARGYRNAEALLSGFVSPAVAAPEAPQIITGVARGRDLHSDLRDTFGDFLPNRSGLSRDDRTFAWREICRHYEAVSAVSEKCDRGSISSSLVGFLLREVPGLVRPGAKNPGRALARDLQRKLARFRKDGPLALRDMRQVSSGNYRTILCAECWAKAMALDVAVRGKESLAWRTLKESGQMCHECQNRHILDLRRNKSSMPHSIRKALSAPVSASLPWIKSAAAGRLAGPFIPGDWSSINAGDWFVADDVTWNHEVYGFDESGKLEFFRPECLFFADAKSGYPLAWRFIRGRYNGRDIRLTMRDVIRGFGLPRRGFKFENGVWRSATVLDTSRKGWIDFRDTADGFKNMGMLFEMRHAQARNPRGKAALEGEFNILQDRMMLLPGYVGRNEREEKSDALKRLEREAKAGDKKALGKFLSYEEFADRAESVFRKRSNEFQNGARNDGISPMEGWSAGLIGKPLSALPPEVAYITATHEDVVKVTGKGIVINYGKHEHWTYAGENLGGLIGEQVIARYHMDCPELLTVCDMKRTEYFCVIGIRLPAFGASAEEQSAANREIALFNRTPRTIAGMLKDRVAATITRDNEFPPEQRELGREIERRKIECQAAGKRPAPTQEQQRSEALQRLEMSRAVLATKGKEPAYE
jgi:hypothetical protein